MATKTGTRIRKKVKRNVSDGIAFIHASFNNTIVTIADRQGNTLCWATAGGSGCAVWLGPEEAPWAFLAGAGTGFVPLLGFEVWWFYRAGHRLQPSEADSESGSDGGETR